VDSSSPGGEGVMKIMMILVVFVGGGGGADDDNEGGAIPCSSLVVPSPHPPLPQSQPGHKSSKSWNPHNLSVSVTTLTWVHHTNIILISHSTFTLEKYLFHHKVFRSAIVTIFRKLERSLI